MNVIEIPAKPKEGNNIRVAAYARVSADKDAAFHSLEAQTEYYEEYVNSHPSWNLVGIYSDNAISGTTINRPEFQRLLQDCRDGKIDLVITKSITRFARNTVILLQTTRELKELGIDCYFEKENMHSISPDGEFFLTLLAMYAEEEARSASENQKWRIKRRFEAGEPWDGRMLGYRLSNRQLTIVPEEAELVCKIFSDYLDDKSIQGIAKELTRSDVPAARSSVWNRSTILKILKNEKYTGNMVLQKTYRKGFHTERRVDNHGEVRMYQVSNSHEAIISKEMFDEVQYKLQKNRKREEKQPTRHIFSGLIRCGLCGSAHVRGKSHSDKYMNYVWKCRRYNDFGKDICPSKPIREDILIQLMQDELRVDQIDNETLLSQLSGILVPCHHKLILQYQDGTEKEVEWKHRSRSESWTPEMRQQARERALARYRKDEE